MCTLAVSFGVFSRYPLVVAANRDEFYERESEPPRILGRDPVIYGPRDARAGGTWTGLNEHGLFVGMTNLSGVSPRDPRRRSRGVLVLDALKRRNAREAAEAMHATAGPGAFNPFQAVLCDGRLLYMVKYLDAPVTAHLAAGVHIFSNWDELPDVAAYKDTLVRGRVTALDREAGIGEIAPALIGLLSDHTGDEWHHRLCVHTDGYGTRSSLVYAVDQERDTAVLLFADGHPCEAAFRDCSRELREAFGW